MKSQFRDLLIHNPHISKVFDYNDSVVGDLQSENYSYIVDLQKNRKSVLLRKKLGIESYTFNKLNIKKWLLVQSGINLLPEKHILERYFEAISKLNVSSDSMGCDFFSKDGQVKTKFKLPNEFIVLAVGAAHKGKRFSSVQIESLCLHAKLPIVLLGDQNDFNQTKEITVNTSTINLCGQTTILELGQIIKLSTGVISGDTGIMHIAACFEVPQVSVWGCTRPSLGMWPYLKENHISVSPKSSRPCSKLGNRCRNLPNYCMHEHNYLPILNNLEILIEKNSL